MVLNEVVLKVGAQQKNAGRTTRTNLCINLISITSTSEYLRMRIKLREGQRQPDIVKGIVEVVFVFSKRHVAEEV